MVESEETKMCSITMSNGQTFQVVETPKLKKLIAEALGLSGGKKGSSGKSSINGAPMDKLPEVSEKDGELVFKHSDYKMRKFEKSVIESAQAEFVSGNIFDTNKRTGTRFVKPDGVVIGENLVVASIVAGLIE